MEKDENGEPIVTPRSFTFERWLADKLKEKRKAKEKKLKDEQAAQESELEKLELSLLFNVIFLGELLNYFLFLVLKRRISKILRRCKTTRRTCG